MRELKPNPAMTRGMKVERAPLQTFVEEEEGLEKSHRWKICRKEKKKGEGGRKGGISRGKILPLQDIPSKKLARISDRLIIP